MEKILPSYEKANTFMSRQSVHELYLYLKTSRWVSTADRPSNHQAYRYFRGNSSHRPNKPQRYYPYFFVIQAMYPDSEAARKMYLEMEQHWGVRLDPKQPFYPHLVDAEQERKLIMGHVTDEEDPSQHDSVVQSRLNSYPGLSTGQSTSSSSGSNQDRNCSLPTTADDQVVSNDYKDKLATMQSELRSELEKRFSELESDYERQKDVVGD
ncbi:hypothetical protein FPOAC2_02873 [Fusarium poae]|jgi:hypothetical protein|nr:hypothetical protein FPOAC1_002770 [Fusarium poae]KAG8676762.1 hypothetical protein FPOAC1_002770 [Fusarium poae]